jgi:hypothetical protein
MASQTISVSVETVMTPAKVKTAEYKPKRAAANPRIIVKMEPGITRN